MAKTINRTKPQYPTWLLFKVGWTKLAKKILKRRFKYNQDDFNYLFHKYKGKKEKFNPSLTQLKSFYRVCDYLLDPS